MRKSYRDSVNNSSGSRPSDKGGRRGRGRSSRSWDKRGGRLLKKCFSAVRVSVWSKNKGVPGPRPPPGSSPRQSLRCFNFSIACYRRSDSGERCEVPLYFSSLSLLRTALHYLNAWNRLTFPLLSIERRGVMTCYHGSEICGSQQKEVFCNGEGEQQKSNRFRLTKEQLCTCITRSRCCATATWNLLISRVRFMQSVNTTQKCIFHQTLDKVLSDLTQKISPTFDKVNEIK